MTARKLNISGMQFSELKALNCTNRKSNNGDFIWTCQCSCGTLRDFPVGRLRSGSATNCGCKTFGKASARSRTHGMSKTREHRSWCHARERINNPQALDYKNYGGAGLKFEPAWNDFSVFIAEVGLMPKDCSRYTIDRIDNAYGYVRGNVRWATDPLQARNKTFQKNNTSGVCGVQFEDKVHPCGTKSTLYAKAIWNNLDGKQCKKHFKVSTYGLLPAFAMACAYREKMIKELNEQGAGYSDNHGK